MMSAKIQRAMSKTFFLFLENFSMKIDVSSFKKVIDYMFKIVEKIIIKLKKLLPSYIKYYVDIIDKEINIAKISSSTRVVHIGCGPIPSTSILIAKKTGANIIGVDKNPRTVEKARSCLHELGYANKIQIKQAEASNFPIENFDVILISHGIEPRDKFLKYVSKSMKEDAIVVFRTFSSDLGELIESDAFLKDIFKIDKIASHRKHGSVISVTLLKNKKIVSVI